MALLIQFEQEGHTISAGNHLSGVLATTGQAAAVYNIAQISGTSTSGEISDKSKYPYTLRSYAPSPFQASGTAGTIQAFMQQEGPGWEKVALLCTAEGYGISMANGFIDAIENTEVQLVAYQQNQDWSFHQGTS